MRLLLIDDNLEVLSALKDYCLATNLASFIATASSGREALNICSSEDFDGVVCDYEMPELDGIDVFTLMKEMVLKMPPFIIFSGNVAMAKSIAQEKNLDIHALINKPHFEQLTHTLHEIKSQKDFRG
ncbi:MAG: hypothetical protein COW00_09475 [Bdellovibrio sp. CG12_big_fil_rev_8_21_14_0_65_39_13]|nr:MAG: hypothetical protein COW78_15065 [Bdellovibrio sp. CG22_combo_CG10-13_8_21_14_all_39_27]PIQ59649.1 MAG: hypothetical protein COW00_09475 [Bdellovibrio sp. CG12_big_fil_rev_8_21_14_0_65_39_13]PIR33399.1 MAG: hypothetical protein COV37_16595 [Bdellovibrio sp. CG11_big_fil_rev_8_21_14_0_20_39_38]